SKQRGIALSISDFVGSRCATSIPTPAALPQRQQCLAHHKRTLILSSSRKSVRLLPIELWPPYRRPSGTLECVFTPPTPKSCIATPSPAALACPASDSRGPYKSTFI